jgi:hypothetical protein
VVGRGGDQLPAHRGPRPCSPRDRDAGLRTAPAPGLVKILDIDLMIINLAYSQETIDRLSKFTGMSRKLIERCIQLKK